MRHQLAIHGNQPMISILHQDCRKIKKATSNAKAHQILTLILKDSWSKTWLCVDELIRRTEIGDEKKSNSTQQLILKLDWRIQKDKEKNRNKIPRINHVENFKVAKEIFEQQDVLNNVIIVIMMIKVPWVNIPGGIIVL